MELREYNYRTPQFLKKIRALLRRDSTLIHGAFQRSVILTRKGSPRQHAITRIDLYADGKQFKEEKKYYEQVRFISEHLSLEKLVSRLRRLPKLRFTSGTTSVNFPNQPGFHNEYRPRNNEFSDWPGTLFDISLESVYLSSDLLSAPNLPTQETEYSAVGDFLGFSRFDSHDGRVGHILLFVPNYNGRIEDLTLTAEVLTINLKTSVPLDELVLEVTWSNNNQKARKEILPKSESESVTLGFSPHTLNIWLKSKRGYFLDFHSENFHWSSGVSSVLPKANVENSGTITRGITGGGLTSLDDFSFLSTVELGNQNEVDPTFEEEIPASAAFALAKTGSNTDRKLTGEPEIASAKPPRIFISYSWDTEEHKQWVLQFATRLQEHSGIEVVFDQWDLVPGKDKNHFMETSVAEVDFVILVCTPQYAKKANARTGGVGYEAMIITGELAERIEEGKFIPVLRTGEFQNSLPRWIKTKVGVDLRGDPYPNSEYQRLVRAVHREPPPRPLIGPKPQWPLNADIKGTTQAESTVGLDDQAEQEKWDEAARLAKGMVLTGHNPITVAMHGDSFWVNISSFGAHFTDRDDPVYYNSGSIAGLALGVRYYIFANDRNRSGGPVTYQATTIRKDALAGAEKIYIGSILLKR